MFLFLFCLLNLEALPSQALPEDLHYSQLPFRYHHQQPQSQSPLSEPFISDTLNGLQNDDSEYEQRTLRSNNNEQTTDNVLSVITEDLESESDSENTENNANKPNIPIVREDSSISSSENNDIEKSITTQIFNQKYDFPRGQNNYVTGDNRMSKAGSGHTNMLDVNMSDSDTVLAKKWRRRTEIEKPSGNKVNSDIRKHAEKKPKVEEWKKIVMRKKKQKWKNKVNDLDNIRDNIIFADNSEIVKEEDSTNELYKLKNLWNKKKNKETRENKVNKQEQFIPQDTQPDSLNHLKVS